MPSARHATQNPWAVSQYGVGEAHCPFVVHVATHRWVAGLHVRAGSPQFEAERHATHWCVEVSQYGLVPPHWAFVVH